MRLIDGLVCGVRTGKVIYGLGLQVDFVRWTCVAWDIDRTAEVAGVQNVLLVREVSGQGSASASVDFVNVLEVDERP